jgi:hypothetical protein
LMVMMSLVMSSFSVVMAPILQILFYLSPFW